MCLCLSHCSVDPNPLPPQAMLVQLSPRECLVVSHDSHSEAGRLTQVLRRNNVLITERKKCECLTLPPAAL